MFAQVITIQAPIDQIDKLRRLVAEDYLPIISNRAGFVASHLLEQIDDQEAAKLLIYWDTQASAENAQATGVLSGSINSIAAQMPGLRIQRQSYIVHVTVDAHSRAASV